MRLGFLGSAAVATMLMATPVSFAFEIQHVPGSSEVGAGFSDNPNSQSYNATSNLSGDSNTSSVFHVGNTTMRVTGGSQYGYSRYQMSPAMQEQFMGGPDQIGNAVSPR